jgi:hypothetical protein
MHEKNGERQELVPALTVPVNVNVNALMTLFWPLPVSHPEADRS